MSATPDVPQDVFKSLNANARNSNTNEYPALTTFDVCAPLFDLLLEMIVVRHCVDDVTGFTESSPGSFVNVPCLINAGFGIMPTDCWFGGGVPVGTMEERI